MKRKNVGKGNSVRPAHFGAWILSSRPILTLRSELHQWWTLSVQEFPLSGDNGALGALDPRVAWNQANCEAEHLSKWWGGGGPGGPPGHRAQRMHTSSKGWALALVWPGVRAAMISSDCKQMCFISLKKIQKTTTQHYSHPLGAHASNRICFVLINWKAFNCFFHRCCVKSIPARFR